MTKLYIYLISQSDNTDYNTYDSAIVVAENEEQAKRITPEANTLDQDGNFGEFNANPWKQSETWAYNISFVEVKKIGICTDSNYKAGDLVLANFNAGCPYED